MATNNSTVDYLRLTKDAEVLRRFWSKVEQHSPSECWPWRGCRNAKGYGRLAAHGRFLRAARVSWVIAFDREIPDGHLVLHRCDNPPCVNPSHLSIGTYRDNMRDAKLRGRLPSNLEAWRGEQSYRTRLTDNDIRIIRASTDRHAAIAARYGLNRSTVSKIKRGERWQHVA
jgi:hypothetical protein